MIRFMSAAALVAAACLPLTGLLATRSPVSAQEAPQIAQGRAHYVEHCQLCHGADGQKGEAYQMPIWGPGAQISKFGNAQGLVDYMQLMPFNDPSLLNETQKLAVVAYMLAQHGSIKPSDTLQPNQTGTVPIR